MGRNPTPTAKLKLYGGFDHNKKRYEKRMGEPTPEGYPEKPGGLSEWASVHWDCVVPELISTGIAKCLDTFALESMCEWWAEWKLLSLDKKIDAFKRITMMSCAHKQWRDLASRFGLTPADRAKLCVMEDKDFDPAAEFIA